LKPRDIAAVVLAGGASSRMGRPKALMLFGGEPLAARILARLRPQAAVVYLNARERDPALAAFGAPLALDDPHWRGCGPLAGVAAGLARAAADGFARLATVPCDAPFLPLDLVARFAEAEGPAFAVSAAGPEPMFALWPTSALPAIEAALASGRASPRATLAGLGATPVVFAPAGPIDPFANINTPEEFTAAEDLLKASRPAPAGKPQGEQS
jgi:molybdopterin-guanine dinucleotide biosynthesis protein A